ncbi:hypothetical protein B0T16DRAFT_409330 [Cercophora newfieldiana]|uniref:Uncharacterized protein n=1 Tax=Cercophora newfieldiana TaxID=92897 RepID=A0AA39YAH9_9PEZI|nr:hypothetical protein B0T16DRAFT_409330 [Cercophora newfieldiana]
MSIPRRHFPPITSRSHLEKKMRRIGAPELKSAGIGWPWPPVRQPGTCEVHVDHSTAPFLCTDR